MTACRLPDDRPVIDRWFRAHPRAVGESYGQHFRVAGRVGIRLIGGGLGALVHAIVPSLCARTGSTAIRTLHAELYGRGADIPDAPAE